MDVCLGNAQCVAAAPEVFRLGDDDLLEIVEAEPPVSLRSAVERAVRLCPTQAITLED
jgi:ferredoxin